MPMGPRPLPGRQVPPPCTMVWPPGAGPSATSVLGEGPLLAGMMVTVLPGGSSRSLAGMLGEELGTKMAGTARTATGSSGMVATGSILGAAGFERRALRRAGRATGRTSGLPSSSGEAISTWLYWVGSARLRAGRDAVCFASSVPHPARAIIARGSSKMGRMESLTTGGICL
jgi:hypothetical protein